MVLLFHLYWGKGKAIAFWIDVRKVIAFFYDVRLMPRFEELNRSLNALSLNIRLSNSKV